MANEENDMGAALEAQKIKYIEIMEQFLAHKEWDDEFEVNEENAQVTLESGLTIGDQQGKLFVELNYDSDMVDVYIYYGFRCKKNKSDEMIKLFNDVHLRFALGRFELLPDGRIRWRHRVDFEGSIASGISIDRIVQPGWNCTERFVETIVAVAMTNQTAAEAIEEHDEARAAAQAAQNDDAPREL